MPKDRKSVLADKELQVNNKEIMSSLLDKLEVFNTIRNLIAGKTTEENIDAEVTRLVDNIRVIRKSKMNNGEAYLVACPVCHKSRWKSRSRYMKSIIDAKRLTTPGMCINCYSIQRAELHATWRGGKIRATNGYIMVKLQPDDAYFAMANCSNYVFEHRIVMARHLGRCLKSYELVHHINHIRDDNRVENLKLITTDNHNQFTVLETRILKLEKKVQRQQWQISLLLWWIGEIKDGKREQEQSINCIR